MQGITVNNNLPRGFLEHSLLLKEINKTSGCRPGNKNSHTAWAKLNFKRTFIWSSAKAEQWTKEKAVWRENKHLLHPSTCSSTPLSSRSCSNYTSNSSRSSSISSLNTEYSSLNHESILAYNYPTQRYLTEKGHFTLHQYHEVIKAVSFLKGVSHLPEYAAKSKLLLNTKVFNKPLNSWINPYQCHRHMCEQSDMSNFDDFSSHCCNTVLPQLFLFTEMVKKEMVWL